jgi:hypothetical protein
MHTYFPFMIIFTTHSTNDLPVMSRRRDLCKNSLKLRQVHWIIFLITRIKRKPIYVTEVQQFPHSETGTNEQIALLSRYLKLFPLLKSDIQWLTPLSLNTKDMRDTAYGQNNIATEFKGKKRKWRLHIKPTVTIHSFKIWTPCFKSKCSLAAVHLRSTTWTIQSNAYIIIYLILVVT